MTDLKPEGRGEVVVFCVLTEDNIQTLDLKLTDIAEDREKEIMPSSIINLFDETVGRSVGTFTLSSSGGWTLPYAALPGHEYRLEINIPGREEISARTVMPQKVHLTYKIGRPDQALIGDLDGHLADTVDSKEMGCRAKINSLPDGPVWIVGMNYDSAMERHVPAELIATSIINADMFNVIGRLYHFDDFFNPDVLTPPGEPEAYYYNSVTGEIVPKHTLYYYVEDQPLHQRYIRIPSIQEGGGRIAADLFGFFSVSGSFEGDYLFHNSTPSETNGYVLYMAPSEEFDRYLKAALQKKNTIENTKDYASLFSRDNIYTNIVNGVGIFGARTEQKKPWNNYLMYDYEGEWKYATEE